MVYNSGFTGYTIPFAFCTFPDLPDFYPDVDFPGVGIFQPGSRICLPSASPVLLGLDGDDHAVWTCGSPTASPTSPAFYTDFQSFAPGTRQFATHAFAMAGPAGNGAGGVHSLNGNNNRGVFCAMSGDGSVGNEQGYGLLLTLTERSAMLVQFTNGLNEFIVLTRKPFVWELGSFKRVTLTCVPDPIALRGVYLKAEVGGIVIGECAYAGTFASTPAYVPSGISSAGIGAIAFNICAIYHVQ